MFKKTEYDSCCLVQQAVAERWGIWSLEDGLQQLPEQLGKWLIRQGVEIKLDEPVLEVEGFRVITEKADYESDHIFLTLPSHVTAKILETCTPEVSRLLAQTPFADTAVVNIEYQGDHLTPKAFGFLVPSHATEVPILGNIKCFLSALIK